MRVVFLIFVITNISVFAQESDITSALRRIDSGDLKYAATFLKDLRSKNPNDPSVIFLDAVLTINGEEALKKYSIVYEKFPKSRYADASLYRIFSYYYSLGYYKKAETYLNKLKTEFPNSPYNKSADRNIPDTEEIVRIPPEDKADSINYIYTIQAGAFLNLDNAKKLHEQIQTDGYYSEITTKEVGGSILNVVNVGRFVNETETKSVLDYLLQKFNVSGRIISLIK
ncbi:MAG: SPOR domain-containing protein [Bacteroidota bacterium]|jgi:tetratricopeptide (TPR) repeat protein